MKLGAALEPRPPGRILPAIAAVALLAAVAAAPGCGGHGASRPNVLLVVIDTLRADHTTPYGYRRDTTPNLKRLADEGLLFENAWSQAPWTIPSMVSLFTGRYVAANHGAMPPSVPTLAERFRDGGYRTGAVVANPLLFERTGFERGFESYEVAEHEKGKKRMPGADLLERSEALLAGIEEPFFCWLHLYDPHSPYGRPDGRFLDDIDPRGLGVDDYRRLQPEHAGDEVDAGDLQTIRTVIASYDSEIRRADNALGGILAALERRGVADRTVVVVTSDHGEGMFSHAEYEDARDGVRDYGLYLEHGEHVYEESVHVPLVYRGPGLPRGARRSELAENLDVFPTLLSLASLEPDPNAAGIDRFATRESKAVIHAFGTRDHAIRTKDGLKLIHPARPVADDPNPARRHEPWNGGVRRPRLYDLVHDPREHHDLAAERPEDVRSLSERLHAWYAAAAAAVDVGGPVSDEMERRLRELGYTR